ncbi:MAG: hypothetical protein RL120_02310 [Gammaproteobacteria bacterium]
MQVINHTLRLGAASLLALALSGYLYSASAHAAGRDISHVNRGINVAADEEVGDVSSVNGSIEVNRGASTDDVETVNGRIEIEDNATVADAETVNGRIRVGSNVVVRGSLETVNGSITTRRGTTIERGVDTVNGRIELQQTRVGGNVQTSNGDIHLEDDTVIEGDLVIRSRRNFLERFFNWHNVPPKIYIDGSSSVLGDIHLYQETELEIDDRAQVGEIIRHY